MPAAAADRAPAVLQSIHEIGARTLPGRIHAHGDAGEKGDGQRKQQDGGVQTDPVFERQIIHGEFRDDGNDPERQAGADDAGEQADEGAFKHKEPDDTLTRRAQRHAQGNLAPATGKPNE